MSPCHDEHQRRFNGFDVLHKQAMPVCCPLQHCPLPSYHLFTRCMIGMCNTPYASSNATVSRPIWQSEKCSASRCSRPSDSTHAQLTASHTPMRRHPAFRAPCGG